MPKDGSILFFKRQLGQIPIRENSSGRLYVKVQPNLVSYLELEIKITYESNAVIPQVPIPNAPFTILRRINFFSSTNVYFKAITGELLNALNSAEFYAEPYNTIPADFQAATTTFRANIRIPFSDHTIYQPERTILNTNNYSELELELQFGDIDDLTFAAGPTDSITGEVNVIALERYPLGAADQQNPRQRLVDNFQKIGNKNLATLTLDLPEQALNKTLLFMTKGVSSGSDVVPVNDLIDKIRVYDNNDTMTYIDLTFQQLQSLNTQDYHLENGPDVGVAIVEFGMEGGQPVKPGDYSSLYNSIGRNNPKAEISFIEDDPWDELDLYMFVRQVVTPTSVQP